MSRLGRLLFHQLTYRHVDPPSAGRRDDAYDDASVDRFLGRFGGPLDVAGTTVLDVGCGTGVLVARLARMGAVRATGVDLATDIAAAGVRRRFPDVLDRVRFVSTAGGLEELGDERFDVVVSKDAMEHFDAPEAFVQMLTGRLRPGGRMIIGFGPLWRSPHGAHIDFMTPVPWVHLVFSEQTILEERRRFRPDEHATRWSEIQGGLNKMTLTRFEWIMQSTGLERTYFATNVSDNRAVKILRQVARVPPLRELATVSAYGIWRAPAA